MTKASQLTLNSSKNIERSLGFITTAASAMAAGVAASLTAVIDKAEDYAFSIQKAADATGTSSEMFSKLAYNAKLSGVPFDRLNTSMIRLSRTAFSAGNGNKLAIAAFAALGISAKDLQGPLSNSGDLFVAVSKKLDRFASSTNKVGLEQKLFGIAGAEIDPLLKQIASGFDTASQQATLFGVVIGDKTAAQARQLHQSMVQLESIALGFSLRLLSGVAPALGEVSDKIIRVVTSADGMKTIDSIAKTTALVVRDLGSAFEYLFNHASTLKTLLEGYAAIRIGSVLLGIAGSAFTAGTGLSALATGLGRFALSAVGLGGVTKSLSGFAPILTALSSTVTGTVASAFSGFGASVTANTAIADTALVSMVATMGNAGTAAKMLASNVGTTLNSALIAIRGVSVEETFSRMKFALLDVGIVAEQFGRNIATSVAGAFTKFRAFNIASTLESTKFAFLDAGIVAENYAGVLLNKVRVAMVAIQNTSITEVLAAAGASIASFARVAITSLTGVTVALGELAVAALLNPLTWIVLGVAGIVAGTVALYKFRDATISVNGETFKLRDTWNAAWLAIKDGFTGAADIIKNVWSSVMDFLGKNTVGAFIEKQIGALSSLVSSIHIPVPQAVQEYLEQAKKNREGDSGSGFKNYGNAESIAEHKKGPKLDAPNLPKETKEKVDSLKLKMDELANAANSAMQSLADAGKGVDFQRADEIAKEYVKTLLEMQAIAKRQGKVFSDTGKLMEDIATKINDSAQEKFKDDLITGTKALLDQATAQDILTAAQGRGADAVRQAQSDAEATTRLSGQSKAFIANNAKEEADRKAAIQKTKDGANTQSDDQNIRGVQAEINAQMRLNSAILGGKDARDAAALANRQAAINKDFDDRGDTNSGAREKALAADRESFELAQRTADLNKAASLSPAQAFIDEKKAIEDATQAARDMGQALSDQSVAAANKANWLQYLDAIDKTTLAVGSASDGVSVFFQQMARQTKSAAQQVYDVLGGAFESLNGMIEKLISGQKVNFADFFRGIASQFAKIAIQKGEQAIAGTVLGKLGIGSSATPQQATTTAVRTVNTTLTGMAVTLNGVLDTLRSSVGGLGGDSGNGLSGALGALGGSSSGSGDSGLGGAVGAIAPVLSALIPGGGFLTGIGSLFGGLFGGHKALGGDVQAGVTYDVGEMGREEFTPTQDGKITPHNKSGGSTAYYSIDARGANEEAVNQRVQASLLQVHESAIRTSVNNVREGVRRKPRSARF